MSSDPAQMTGAAPARTAAVVGVGEAGANWIARFALMGWQVRAYDPSPGVRERVSHVMARAARALPGLHDAALPPRGPVTLCDSLEDAVGRADWISECLPDRLEAKHEMVEAILEVCREEAIVATTGGFYAASLQLDQSRPGQIVATRGCGPAYLLPLVELGVTEANPPELADRAEGILRAIGMVPVRSTGVADRLRDAIERASAEMVAQGAAGAADIARVLALGPGLVWAQAGSADPAARDRALVGLMRALKWQGAGVGAELRAFDAALGAGRPGLLDAAPLPTLAMAVPPDWTDYNGHMTEARYLEVFGYATDRFMELVGATPDYIAAGMSFFTAETHIRHLDEAHVGDPLAITTQCLMGEGRKMSLFHELRSGERLLATAENMMIHVDLASRRACPPAGAVAARLAQVAALHATLPRPEGAGRAIGQLR